jgi:hypothetical protein
VEAMTSGSLILDTMSNIDQTLILGNGIVCRDYGLYRLCFVHLNLSDASSEGAGPHSQSCSAFKSLKLNN